MFTKSQLRRLEGLLVVVIIAIIASLFSDRSEEKTAREPHESTTFTAPDSSENNQRKERNERKNTGEDSSSEEVDSSIPVPDSETCKVDWVVDGDTLFVLSCRGREKVRFVGCNAPETVKRDWPVEPFGPEASAYTKKRIEETGHLVTLVADGDRIDQYGRRLAMVYLGPDTSAPLINEELISKGLARATLHYHFSNAMKDRFHHAQNQAKHKELGIWSLPQ